MGKDEGIAKRLKERREAEQRRLRERRKDRKITNRAVFDETKGKKTVKELREEKTEKPEEKDFKEAIQAVQKVWEKTTEQPDDIYIKTGDQPKEQEKYKEKASDITLVTYHKTEEEEGVDPRTVFKIVAHVIGVGVVLVVGGTVFKEVKNVVQDSAVNMSSNVSNAGMVSVFEHLESFSLLPGIALVTVFFVVVMVMFSALRLRI